MLRAESDTSARALAFLERALAAAPADRDGITVFQPVAMALPRLARMERVQVVVQSSSRPRLQAWLQEWTQSLYGLRATGARWHLDIDPTEF